LLMNKELEKTRMPIIKCRCGAKILLLPDLNAMNKAVEAHARSHGRRQKDPFQAAAEADRVRDDLIRQIFKKASGTRQVLGF
jgi:hypothetical protein